MEFGIVKWFSEPRGFGFILPDSPNAHDMFTHIRDVATGVPLSRRRQETAALRDLNPAYDRSGSKPGPSPWGPHVRFRRVQTWSAGGR